jgi:hypothetical protein
MKAEMSTLEPSFLWYLAAWGMACLAALWLILRDPSGFPLFQPGYRRFLSIRWKLWTFLVATLGLTLIAPYTGDPTWDYYDALFMSVLTYCSAPWAVGTLYLAFRGRARPAHVYVAVCLWLFSASWSYDLYILLRDGRYPEYWVANLIASSVLYMTGGLFWNLDWREGRGPTFSFIEPGWLSVTPAGEFRRIAWYAVPLMLVPAAVVLYFVVPYALTSPS